MLHIILFILKCIGWILLAILAILLLLVVLVLFLPFCYKGEGSCEGDLDSIKAGLRFSWFFHLIAGKINVENRQVDWSIRIAWKKIKSTQTQQPVSETVQQAEEVDVESTLLEKQASGEKQTVAEERISIEEKIPLKEKKAREHKKTSSDTKQAEKNKSIKKKHRKKRRTSMEHIWESVKKSVLKFFEKIKYTFHKICATIKAMLKKKDKLLAFIEDKAHKAAFFAACKELCRLLKFAKPKHFKAEIEFGFEDPTNTGLVLAAVSMIYPVLGEYTVIRPDFEQAILEANARIDGKLRVVYPAIVCWNLFWNKEIRITYKHLKKFKW